MSLGSVLLNLAKRGIEPTVKMFGEKTLLKYELGGKQFVQLFDDAGKISKFKIHSEGIFGGKAITKGSTTNEFGLVQTIKTKKDIGLSMTDKTVVTKHEMIPGVGCTEIKYSGASGEGKTYIDFSTRLDGTHYGTITKEGPYHSYNTATQSFDTKKTIDGFGLDSYNQYGLVDNNPYGLNNSYMPSLEDDTSRMLRQMEEENQRLLEQQRRDDDDFLTMIGLGPLGF